MGRICDICNYDLGEQTEFNFERHRNSNQCKANQRKKKVEVCGKSITNYFKLSNNANSFEIVIVALRDCAQFMFYT